MKPIVTKLASIDEAIILRWWCHLSAFRAQLDALAVRKFVTNWDIGEHISC